MAISRKTETVTSAATASVLEAQQVDLGADFQEYGNHEVVTAREVAGEKWRANPAQFVKESGQELAHTRWMGVKELCVSVVTVVAFLVLFMGYLFGLDALAGVTLIPLLSGQLF